MLVAESLDQIQFKRIKREAELDTLMVESRLPGEFRNDLEKSLLYNRGEFEVYASRFSGDAPPIGLCVFGKTLAEFHPIRNVEATKLLLLDAKGEIIGRCNWYSEQQKGVIVIWNDESPA